MPTIGHGWIDFDRGVFHRKAPGEKETKKRKPPVRIPDRLINHMKRWRKNGQRFVVEYLGHNVSDIGHSFRRCAKEARLVGVSPHTLSHTAATWLMQGDSDKWEAAGYLGMTLETLERVYGHHHPDFQKSAASIITNNRGDLNGDARKA